MVHRQIYTRVQVDKNIFNGFSQMKDTIFPLVYEKKEELSLVKGK